MTAMFVVACVDAARLGSLEKRADRSMREQGFDAPRVVRTKDAVLYWYPTPGAPGEAEQIRQVPEGQDCIGCVGTVFKDGVTGHAALDSILQEFSSDDFRLSSIGWGNYALAVFKGGNWWVLSDPLGMVKIYRTSDRAVWSTSWLCCADAADKRTIDPVGVTDFVFSGANHGDRTVVREVLLADPSLAHAVTGERTFTITDPSYWSSGERFSSWPHAVDACADILCARAAQMARAFPGRIHSALSGGFDSRLILAALRRVGATPMLHVYGAPGDEDVEIASDICTGLGLTLEHIDKRVLDASKPRLDAAKLRAQLLFFDAIPVDGIFDRGSDRDTRIRQSAGGSLALNGGGGEILRNFFYLQDRPFSARELVGTFYGNWPAKGVRSATLRRDYLDYLEAAIRHSTGGGSVLSRPQVELAYPLFRVRYWTSRNNSMAARCGHFLTPLADPELVRLSQSLPLEWKDYGRFEAAVLARLDPELAKFRLTYGFTPEAGPSAAYRRKMWLQHRRPPWLRQKSVAIKARLGMVKPAVLSSEVAGLVPGGSWLGEMIDVGQVFDEGQLLRAANLKLVFDRLQS